MSESTEPSALQAKEKSPRGRASSVVVATAGQSGTAIVADDDPTTKSTSASNVVEHALREPGTLQRLLCGAIAWTVTVGPLAFSSVGSAAPRVLAILAILCGLVGPALAVRRRQIGRHVGISAFLAFSAGTWLLTPLAIDSAHI